jgi:hypothetical protein
MGHGDLCVSENKLQISEQIIVNALQGGRVNFLLFIFFVDGFL